MPASHDHDDEAFDATDNGDVEVTAEEEEALRQAQLDELQKAGF